MVSRQVPTAVAIWLMWVGVLRSAYGVWPFLSGNTEAPFAGFTYRLHNMTGGLSTPASWVHALAMATLTLQMVLSLWLVVVRARLLTCLIALAGVALASQGGVSIYLNLESYTRVFWWMPLGVWLWSMQTGRVWASGMLCVGVIWPIYALAQAAFKVHQGAVTVL